MRRRLVALVLAAPSAAAFALLQPAATAAGGCPSLRAHSGLVSARSPICALPALARRGHAALAMSGTPLDQAKALPPLDLTEENVEQALEEAKEMLGEASVKPPTPSFSAQSLSSARKSEKF